MIRGYVEQPSPRPGGSLTLRVATDAPRFRVEFYRCGPQLVRCGGSPWLDGVQCPPHQPFQDWGEPGLDQDGRPLAPWPAYRFPVAAEWCSGVYVAVLVEGDGASRDRGRSVRHDPGQAGVGNLGHPDRTTADGRDSKALFVVRTARSGPRARILYKIPLLTYHAYNPMGGWCLYDMPDGVPPGVGLHRPGGGTGATPYDITNPDPFDPTPRQTFAHWDARFVKWLEAAGYPVDYCTDVDLHRDGADLLTGYQLLVSVGHDEYWSDAMRAALDGFVTGGGNAAFFSGNTCWWRVVFQDEVRFSRVGFWHEQGPPENTSVGVSFRNGGERDRADFPVPVGYRVQHAEHWVYAGTGLRDGDVFGAGPDEYLIGYECDGAEFDRADLVAGRPVHPTGTDGTPKDFTILAVGDTRSSGAWGFGNGAATMGLFQHGGTVFNAATTDWARVLTAGTTPAVERITRNVLDRLSRPQAE